MFFQQIVTRDKINEQPVKIRPGSIQLWLIDISSFDPEIFADSFSIDEIRKANGFFFPKDRKTYLACRGMLRFLIGKFLNVAAAAVQFDYTRYGKLELAFPNATDLFFNLSHSGDFGLLAFRKNHPVGVDLEQIGVFENQTLAKNVFSPIELAEFNSFPDHLKSVAFYYGWTRKEAFIKAIGLGLSFPLQNFSVSTNPEKQTSKVIINVGKALVAGEWEIYDIPCGPGYCGAVAVENPDGGLIESFRIDRSF